MEPLFHMVYMFLCPQGDTVYTDNIKMRGSVRQDKIKKWNKQDFQMTFTTTRQILLMSQSNVLSGRLIQECLYDRVCLLGSFEGQDMPCVRNNL